jgi:ribosomal protein L30E
MNTQEIRKLLEQDKLIIGYKEVRKAIADKAVVSVHIASNAEEQMSAAISDYCDITEIESEVLDLRNDQLGTACRKPFSISFLAVKA